MILDNLATKKLSTFSIEVRAKFNDLFEILSKVGKLEMPFAKKIGNQLFEIRIKHRVQWRAIYAYILKNQVVILSAFQKKTQKIPKKELTKALKRLKKY
ncbi:MAG: hypothetical protein AUJ41_00425 [Candidatus Pacebacteria bacterium CG1_02_43_31]|nr:type II toxin-antitoxin system RelE/ParE family toxin [Candidatus Pacearchaeota archaeon]NCQ66070.1 type II toxin-antitoxin system RelE/ParE family toxin [Candidatus Paceibacterota bacterium]NCS86322.1 type II toxin-antitoxin system RelE/ParE family toxin [Candidatus Paceibacterota bacterium]OIO45215.1 MAG: hypothetical protein AUJ41_00425 [Candidatus Pacebacteria bacterium CG1_02_43_31]